jgi:hypothetical protein
VRNGGPLGHQLRPRRLALSRLSAAADSDPRALLVPDLEHLLDATISAAAFARRAAAIGAETAAPQARLRACLLPQTPGDRTIPVPRPEPRRMAPPTDDVLAVANLLARLRAA